MTIEGWHRDSVVARIVVCVVLAAIWAIILYPTWLGWNTYRALSDGVVTTATVTRIGEGGRYYDTAYLWFVTDDGRVVTASNSDIADIALPGDELSIRYAVSDPSIVQEEGREPVEELLTVAFFLPFPAAATWWYFRRQRPMPRRSGSQAARRRRKSARRAGSWLCRPSPRLTEPPSPTAWWGTATR